jgi:hypothetical protein
MARRSADPLTAASTSILLPSLRSAGFRRKSDRFITRVSADILQFFYLQLSAYGSKDFYVNYASISLFHPREDLQLQPGDRLRRESTGELLPAKTHAEADQSMKQVVQMAETQAIPFFESTKTARGLLLYLEKEKWGSLHHLNLEKACCAAALGRLPEARKYALLALDLYRRDDFDWRNQYVALCEQLVASIETHTTGGLLKQWRDYSISKLRLEKLV